MSFALATPPATAQGDTYFERIASLPVNANLPADVDPLTETSAEIIAVTEDGGTLVYSDGPRGGIGLVDARDADRPAMSGFVALDGEPTAVVTLGTTALVSLNTSASHTDPSGALVAVGLPDGEPLARCELGGQPDSIALAPDGSRLAVAIENERDEDLDDGALPQFPAGHVALLPIVDGLPDCRALVRADVTGLADIAPDDPEPEFVDIDAKGRVAVTLQENNHVVVLDATSGDVISHFSAGSVDLVGVDVDEERALSFDGRQPGRLREPDAVQWLDGDRLVVANEGDYAGGSRGFTIFSIDGEVLHESGPDFEYRVAAAGHYPEERSGNKGVEPEGLEVGRFGDETYLFVLAERAGVIGVYRDTGATPEFVQLLPTAIGPEGAVAIGERGLLAVANEADLGRDGGPRSHVTLYRHGAESPSYPTLVSEREPTGRPIGWGALSGLAADPVRPGILYAVNDGFYAMQPTIYTIDANGSPARIVEALRITRAGMPAQLLDLEGIAPDGEGGFWLASEGRSDRLVPHALYRVDASGEIVEQVPFAPELLAVERRFAAEGIALKDGRVWVALQRPWGDDAPNVTKLLAYDPEDGSWSAVGYPLEPADEGWVGLSELTVGGDAFHVIERDDRIGEAARVKAIYRVELDGVTPKPVGEPGPLPLVAKVRVHDLLPDLRAGGGYVVDKVEGFAIDAAGDAYAVTDNDGVDDSNGETVFLRLDLADDDA